MKPNKPKTEPEPETLTDEELEHLFNNNDPSPYDAFDSVGGVLAFDFQKFGADVARETLYPNGAPKNLQRRLLAEGLQPDYSREDLLDAYDELMALGLNKVAAIALEVSALKVSRFHMPSAPWVSDHRTWEDKERERMKWEQERQRRLSKPQVLAH